ncbi:MAG: hypothetical protein ABI850_19825 [Flavobacterium sp.]
MEWSRLTWYFNILFLIPAIHYSQNKEFKEKEISVDVSSLILFAYDFEIPSEHDEISETNKNSKILAANAFLNYYISRCFAFRAGSGYEFINQPKIDYIPITAGIKWVVNDTEEIVLTSFDAGCHVGAVERFGVLLRVDVGYRLVIFKKILGNFELCFSNQSLYQTFVNQANRKVGCHSIISTGFRIGIEIY